MPQRLRAACAATGGDYGGGHLALLVLALLYVGARRLEHLRYVAGDPLIARFCGLARLPTARTVGNWLRQFTQATLAPLVQLNHDLVIDAVRRLALPRLTIDIDGTVVRTGATVAWAFRGFNPHHRKDPSSYPLLAHILRVKNRPGNVHDSTQSVAFLREVIAGLRTAFGRRRPERQRWLPVAPNVTGFFHDLDIPQWDLRLRVMIYRKHVGHKSPKNFQLDLFTPDDGHFEYAAVATNLALDLPAQLTGFLRARGAGAQQLDWRLVHRDRRETSFKLTLLTPSRDPEHLGQLLRSPCPRARRRLGISGI